MKAQEIKDNLPEFIQVKHDWEVIAERVNNEEATLVEQPTCRPKIYQLEPTSVCNLDCPMCPRQDMGRPMAHMKLELFEKIVNRDMPEPQAIELFGMGESILHPKLPSMLRILKEHGHYSVLATNATILTPKLSDSLVEAGLDFAVLDFDGGDKESYEAIRVNGNYEQTKVNIEDFLKRKKNTFSVVQTILMPQTRGLDIEAYRKEWLEKGADEVRVKFLDTWGGYLMVDEAKEINPQDVNQQPRRACPELFYGADVWQGGQVVPCGRYFDLSYPLGNLNTNSLEEVFHDKPAVELRKVHLNHDWGKLREIGAGRCADCQEWGLTNLRFMRDISNNMFRGGFK